MSIIVVEVDYADDKVELEAESFTVDQDTAALFVEDENGEDVAVFAAGKWLSVTRVKSEPSVLDASNDVEQWTYLGNVPSGIFVVEDAHRDVWYSHDFQSYWVRQRDNKHAHETEYTGPYKRSA